MNDLKAGNGKAAHSECIEQQQAHGSEDDDRVHGDSSSEYTDSPEFQGDNNKKSFAWPGGFSAISEKSAPPFSAFNTPYISTGINKEFINSRYGFKNNLANDRFSEKGVYDAFDAPVDQYPSWGEGKNLPIGRKEIQAIFIQLADVFGFQEDNMKNMYDYFLKMLDSRASRLTPEQSLRSLHADYIGGVNSNFRKWYFASQLDIDDSIGFVNAKSNGLPKAKFLKEHGFSKADVASLGLQASEERWAASMLQLSALDCVVQIALYLLIWGEANNIRFMPECLCFIFKCCNDYFYSIDFNEPTSQVTELTFLDHAITPLYQYYTSNALEADGSTHRDKDHASIIGYDDMNQLFWYRKGLERLVLTNKLKLMDLPSNERYAALSDVLWSKAFYKTYRETRTWLHLWTNFNRIWILHVAMFWIYTSANAQVLYTENYRQALNNQPTLQAKLSAMALAGPLTTLINIIAVASEIVFVPRKWPGSEPVWKRLLILGILFIKTILPSVYIFGFKGLASRSKFDEFLAFGQLCASIVLSIYYSITPLNSLFRRTRHSGRQFMANEAFTSAIHQLQGKKAIASYSLWILIFTSKFVESYFFLTLSLRDPIRELVSMKKVRCVGEVLFGDLLCSREAYFLLILMITTDLVMFFLDTYLWYIVWNTVFSMFRSLHLGISIWTPWKNIFSKLPKRIYTKILVSNLDHKLKTKVLVAQIWNAILISMYNEHLLSLDVIRKLLYKEVADVSGNLINEPNFFISQDDAFMKASIFESQSEAQRRITFFAQSLCTPMPDPIPIEAMPSFTVLIPHYGEKILLSLKEIIKEEDRYSHITLLEYLKQLHPSEWENFVQETKRIVQDDQFADTDTPASLTLSAKYEDLAYYCIGFTSANPQHILRTRVWASLRTQTLFRTISGFMNYSKAIKLLYDVEKKRVLDADSKEIFNNQEDALMALRKTRIVVSMQRFNRASPDDMSDVEFILRTYPEIQIAYLEEEINLDNQKTYYSCLIDGSCEILENGSRSPKYRIRLSGFPILGDGKSDNQNDSLIFTRGEYLQLIDANQDNYIEECLKIRSILAEFEELALPSDPYSKTECYDSYNNPVAIIGTREYIFSENIGVLGDVAAAKEQTFGTLFARTLAEIGGKLHYGHPDFLNVIFMTTRGGISKAQKGLHLNEDVYAGMNALLRGGRIKHCEYMQCGKGRDLGFGSILNFTTKIGSGMGEQILSREYFYIGTQLPVDRFLSIFYAHAGFHLNNVFIFLSIKLFILVCLHMSVLSQGVVFCEFNRNRPITDPLRPSGCSNLMPVIHWLQNYIISISMVFGISFVPLFVQEVTERGILRAFTRLAKHFGSMSPIFEVFVCKIYANSMISDLKVGGARYIGTGRGFATTRVPFTVLYSRFATESIYSGAAFACLLLYISANMWTAPLLYLWYTVAALCLSPFLFNPNQFLWGEFFLDYEKFIKWLCSGNSAYKEANWSSYIRGHRSHLTGSKKKLNSKNKMEIREFKKPSVINLVLSDLIPHIAWTIIVVVAYCHANAQTEYRNNEAGNTLLRLLICSLAPIAFNGAVLLVCFVISVVFGPAITPCFSKFPSLIATFCHILGLMGHVLSFELLLLAENWRFSVAILGLCSTTAVQSLLFKIVTEICISRETKYDASNRAWWSGKWLTSGLGWHILTQPLREYICKLMELSMFTLDFLLGHILLFIQAPFLLNPFIDRWHTLVLLWLRPGRQFRPRILSKREKLRRRASIYTFAFVFIIAQLLLAAILLVPLILVQAYDIELGSYLPDIFDYIIQPPQSPNQRKGLKSYNAHKHY